MDFPYLFGKRWRMWVDLAFENDPNWQYYGVGLPTMQPLRFLDKRTGQVLTYQRFPAYYENLALIRPGDPAIGEAPVVTDHHYNELDYTENLYNIGLERVFAGGRGRAFVGYEFDRIIRDYFGRRAQEAFNVEGCSISDVPNGRTRLTEDYLNLYGVWSRCNIVGYRGGRTSILSFGVIYDTATLNRTPPMAFS